MKIMAIVALLTILYVVGMDVTNRYLDSRNYNVVNVESSSTSTLNVEIKGAIKNPGKYQLNKQDNLKSLISIAGGLETNADDSAFNNLLILKDGESYYIPYGEIDENGVNRKVSINSASVLLLQKLPGIGEVYSARIIEYRLQYGEFSCIEEIMKVKGIGVGIFNNLKDLICL